jgi:hypothetical protein
LKGDVRKLKRAQNMVLGRGGDIRYILIGAAGSMGSLLG